MERQMNDGLRFFRGFMFAMPVSVVLWIAIILFVRAIV